MSVLGKRIKELMKENLLSQREVAEIVGITDVTMSRVINGERIPKGPIIANFAKLFGVSTDYLLGVTDDPHKTSKSSRMIEKEQKWIPVSERMPEIDDGKILGCDQFGQIFIPTSLIKIEEKLYDAKDFKFDVNEFLKGRYIVGGIRMRPRIIVAWMPLPEPYKGERDED